MDRRQFISSTACAAIAAGLSPQLASAMNRIGKLERLGLQLWTVRNQLEQDVVSTIESVANAGYAQVELMSTLNSEAIVEAAHENGLDITSAFIDWQAVCRLGDSDVPTIEQIIERAKEIELTYLVFGYIGKEHRSTLDDYRRIAELANQVGEQCREADLQLCYHNHSFEFEPHTAIGACGFDVFRDRFDHELVKFELDVFWAAIGGKDPVDSINSLDGRLAQIHLKDWQEGGEIIYDESQVPAEVFKEVGSGVLDFESILKAAEEAGASEYHVEQDQSPDPLQSIRTSYRFLQE